MSRHTNIEWCDSTVNPTSGCDGCELFNAKEPGKAICYAKFIHEQRFAWQARQPGSAWEQHYAQTFSEVRTISGRIHEATYWGDLRGKLRLNAKPWLDLLPRCIFVGDLSDIMSRDVPDDFLEAEVFAPMENERGRMHVWMVLTKRPKRLADFSERRPGGLPCNVIAMCSVTDQATADARVPHLLRVRARWHGVSAEPLLGDVSLGRWMYPDQPHLDWVIIGGASGSNAPVCDVGWIEAIADDCRQAGVATFVKQLGKRAGLSHPKGGDVSEWPAGLAVREMPDFCAADILANDKGHA